MDHRPRKDGVEAALQPAIDGLKKEVERLDQIAARFRKSHSVHLDSVLNIISSVKKQIRRLESGRI
jgi:hypothetical protein